ncbi:hypothetical protein ccbrp13_55860 [Ktedonobacteria bacterium brp13]|nr:hypothetical protein ccbrp13_55860 [Ktedonobacteria bacterium brp13]
MKPEQQPLEPVTQATQNAQTSQTSQSQTFQSPAHVPPRILFSGSTQRSSDPHFSPYPSVYPVHSLLHAQRLRKPPESSLHNELTQQMPQIPQIPQITKLQPMPKMPEQSISQPELYAAEKSFEQYSLFTPHLIETPIPADPGDLADPAASPDVTEPTPPKKSMLRWISVGLIATMLVALYLVWQPGALPFSSTATTGTSGTTTTLSSNTNSTQVTSHATTTNTVASSNDTSGLQAYIVGAVHHPGIYTLSTDARIYQLVQAAGGPLPNANMAALNLAARLTDGQEVYVSLIGETPSANVGGDTGSTGNAASAATTGSAGSTTTATANQGPRVNVNTATNTELQQALSISSKSAAKIIDYRVQHGPYASVAALSLAVSKSMYSKIKNKVSV